ncbi:hypothetical protein GA707_07025 [Nostocoides sp. F2B08]|uniref:hypothetical protein n=1 Tax=Nostocoides sp. F2B08 TaxID=2653936 RepID=UPI001262EF9F|nr:hypothetical protein [Tetrasphaera sp. F2B08]KAB7745648.1 hypothetical protein GA707_07025 [Tetrasphaera sp. F2B08]
MRRLLAATTLALVLALTAGCSSGPSGDDGADPAAGAATSAAAGSDSDADDGADGADGSGADGSAAEPVDVAAALTEFEAPPETSGLGAAQPQECPGADIAPMLDAFPDATPFQATSVVVDPPDGVEDEVHLQCRMSYEVELVEGDGCTVMEVRDVFFRPEAQNPAGNDGSLTATSVMTYFIGGARRDGVALDYTLSAGCDEATDLSDLEPQFRDVWTAHRDRFLDGPAYQRP